MGGSAARPAVPYGRTDVKYGISNGTDTRETLVNGKPLKQDDSYKASDSDNFGRNMGMIVGAAEDGIEGAIIGGMLGSMMDD